AGAMVLDGLYAPVQLAGDVLETEARAQEAEDLEFAPGQLPQIAEVVAAGDRRRLIAALAGRGNQQNLALPLLALDGPDADAPPGAEAHAAVPRRLAGAGR